jgi:hypothetical protein
MRKMLVLIIVLAAGLLPMQCFAWPSKFSWLVPKSSPKLKPVKPATPFKLNPTPRVGAPGTNRSPYRLPNEPSFNFTPKPLAKSAENATAPPKDGSGSLTEAVLDGAGQGVGQVIDQERDDEKRQKASRGPFQPNSKQQVGIASSLPSPNHPKLAPPNNVARTNAPVSPIVVIFSSIAVSVVVWFLGKAFKTR